MLYEFKSRSTGDLIMLEVNGRQVMEIPGKDTDAPGILEAADAPAAIHVLEAAVAKAESIFKRCKGWKSFELHRSIEKPSRYRLHIKWETLENHTVDFRESSNFQEWRALVGPHFASPPEVEHTNTVACF